MKRAHLITAVLVSFGLTAACGPGDRREPVDDGLGVGTTTQDTDRRTDTGLATRDPALTQPMQMTVTGCVTEQNNQLMLTQVEATGADRQPGAAYQLVGDTQELRQHIGQRVRVMGAHQTAQMGEPGAQADARDTTPGAAGREPIGTTGEPGRTAADADTLRVSSVTPVEGQCPSPGNR